MQQISFYQTKEDLMDKTIFTLVEKCYQANSKLLILMQSSQEVEHVNKLLWTFSQKKFIPHGSNIDPLPEKQPIYISDQLENLNEAKILLIINQNLNNLTLDKIENFEKILILYNEENYKIPDVEHFAPLVKANKATINHYNQNANGSWLTK